MLQVVEQFLNDKLISATNTRKNYRLSINKYFRDLAGGFSPDWHKLNSEQKAAEEQRLDDFNRKGAVSSCICAEKRNLACFDRMMPS